MIRDWGSTTIVIVAVHESLSVTGFGRRPAGEALNARIGLPAGVRKPPVNETVGGELPYRQALRGVGLPGPCSGDLARKACAGADWWGDRCERYGDFVDVRCLCKAGGVGNCRAERRAARAFT